MRNKKIKFIIMLITIFTSLYGCGLSEEMDEAVEDAIENVEKSIEQQGGMEGVQNNAEELIRHTTDFLGITEREEYVIDEKTGAIITAKDVNGNDTNAENSPTEEIIKSNEFRVGDTIELFIGDTGQIAVTLTESGKALGFGDGAVYVKYTIENIGSTDVTVGEGLFEVYADDYKVDLLSGENTVYSVDVSPGRKMSGTLYAGAYQNEHTIIEVECGPAVFKIWDSSFLENLIGSFSCGDTSKGANITVKYADDPYLSYDYLEIAGECWDGADKGEFKTSGLLEYWVYYDSTEDYGMVVFDHFDTELKLYPLDDGGIYVEQEGSIMNPETYQDAQTASFNGTYYSGMIYVEDDMQTSSDLPVLNGDTYWFEIGANEDAYGAEVTIGYDANGELRIVGETWNSIEYTVVNAAITMIYEDGSMVAECYDIDNGNDGVLNIYPTEDGGIRIEQEGMIGGLIVTTFDGQYQKR